MNTIKVYKKDKFVQMTYSKMFMFKGYKVYVVPDFGMTAAIGFKRKNLISSEKVILVNNRFTRFSKIEKLFCLYHEIGHDKCKHFDKDIKGRDIALEIEADIYSANVLVNRYGVSEHDMPELLFNVLTVDKCKMHQEYIDRYNAMIEAVA